MVNKEYNKKYYHEVRKQKAKLNDYLFHCEFCNCDIFFSNKYRHFKTKKHQKNQILSNFNNETEKEIFKIQTEKKIRETIKSKQLKLRVYVLTLI